jgi:hypothetical protein
LVVTDILLIGDQFRVYNFGASLGLTSAPGSGTSCGFDPEVCLADPNVSSGTFPLGPGNYSIEIEGVLLPYREGATAYFRAVGPEGVVPEPGSWALVAGVLALLGGSRLRRIRRAAPPAA